MEIPNFLKNDLTNDYLKVFLKNKNIPCSNTNKAELLNILKHSLENKKISEPEFQDFLARFYKYGRNRIVISNIINLTVLNPIMTKSSLEKRLSNAKEPTGYFNEILEISETKESNDSMFYQSIKYDENDRTILFERGYFRDEKVVATDSDGTPIYSYKKVFTWIVIDVENRRFNIHTRDLDPNYFGKNTTIRQTNDTFLDIFKKMFSFTVSSALNEERTLYNIYKHMTETAEAPFKNMITDEIKKEISDLYIRVSDILEYNTSKDKLKIPNRFERLFERGLINQNFEIYSRYEVGKVGIIKRIVFFDGTGANVSAMVKEISENISSYDIYFDTRDTLDERKALNKLWAFWYFKSSLDSKEEKYEVKMEIEDDFYVTHFLRKNILEEVAEYVFQQFRKFEVLNA
ncbi:hypothetical protein [Enterococcus casseliflavus]|uniref:hypothetical protein n=1 Tax=Enterococcus casseliflavus TaxID=37734 RepID=UPI0012E216FF|nr:hypothetical protein [Enterococcus casseliflavus]MUN96128.1 hypothetical protein [Enterococcus casseliflavus]